MYIHRSNGCRKQNISINNIKFKLNNLFSYSNITLTTIQEHRRLIIQEMIGTVTRTFSSSKTCSAEINSDSYKVI